VCDLATALMMSKTANIVLKDSPAEPLLPQKLFTEPDLVSLSLKFIPSHDIITRPTAYTVMLIIIDYPVIMLCFCIYDLKLSFVN